MDEPVLLTSNDKRKGKAKENRYCGNGLAHTQNSSLHIPKIMVVSGKSEEKRNKMLLYTHFTVFASFMTH